MLGECPSKNFMCSAGTWAETPLSSGAHGGRAQWGWPDPGVSRCHRQEQLCQLHLEHPSCPCSAGGSLASCRPGHTWNPELSPSSPPSLKPSPCCAFIPPGRVLGRGWFLGTASSWSPQVFAGVQLMQVLVNKALEERIPCELFSWSLPFSPYRFSSLLVTFPCKVLQELRNQWYLLCL